MAEMDPLRLQRAAGAALRGLKRPGVSPQKLAAGGRGEPLRPALAIAALLEAMRARFDLPAGAAERLLLPALADWRDAVGCADPIFVPANAQGAAAEKSLVPLPLPSWCAHLIDAGVLRLDGPPAIDGARVQQHAHLEVVREAELAAVECFPFAFAGRFASGAASLRVHLALSPPFLGEAWRGAICLRAAAQRLNRGQPAVPLWLGPPSTPGAPPANGVTGQAVVTWATLPDDARPPPPPQAAWPKRWPRWAVLRILEGREPQALWDLSALWRARMGKEPEGAPGGAPSGADISMRIAVDLGSTATMILEEDAAASGAVGSKLLGPQTIRSGFRRLAGDARTAHLVGCGERLATRGAQLPNELCAPAPATAAELLAATGGRELAMEQLWLLQAPPEGAPAAEADDTCLRIDRFKSPELLLLSEWLAAVPSEGGLDLPDASRRLLETHGYLLGRALAAAHGAPLVTPEGGSWALRWPRLASAEVVLTYPPCAFSAAVPVPFSRVFEDVGRELCRGLSAAWRNARLSLIADPAAARAARSHAHDQSHPIEAFVDFGGLTLQITVRVPHAPGRPAPFIAGSSTSYLLGGERLIDAAAFASADLAAHGNLREAYRAAARRWRRLIASGGSLKEGETAAAAAVREALLGTLFSLVGRHLEGTLRRAAPDLTRLRGAGVRLYLLGEAWKLIALDAPDEAREAETLRHIGGWLSAHPLSPGLSVELQRMTKRSLCEGALRVHGAADAPEETIELHGVDLASAQGATQRWFAVADGTAEPAPDAAPHADDPWWREFAGEGQGGSLLRVEHWFVGAEDASPFRTSLQGGRLAFDSRRPLLKQWLDLSGPSLVALRIHQALQAK